MRPEVSLEVVEAEDDVRELAFAVRQAEGNKGRPVGHDPGFDPGGLVGQRVDIDGRAVGETPEKLSFDFHHPVSFARRFPRLPAGILPAGRGAERQGEDEDGEGRIPYG